MSQKRAGRPLRAAPEVDRAALAREQRNRESGEDFVRALLMFVGIGVAVFLLATAAWFWGAGHPNTNPESRGREGVLLGLPTVDASAVGLVLVSEYSDAGGEGRGIDGSVSTDDVTVIRTYKYSGEPLASCQLVTAELERTGWSGSDGAHPCEVSGEAGNAFASLHRDCGSFQVSVRVTTKSASAQYDPGTVEIHLEAPYPAKHDAPNPAVEEEYTTTAAANTC